MIAFSITASSVDVLTLNMRSLNNKLNKGGMPQSVSQSVSPRVCVACAPPMRCMCAVTASGSRMLDGDDDLVGYSHVM